MKLKNRITAVFASVTVALTTVTASAETQSAPDDTYVDDTYVQERQSFYEVSRLNRIKPQTQITSKSCATTCAAMCLNVDIEEIRNQGFNIDYTDWDGIAARYGYWAQWYGRDDLKGKNALELVYYYLCQGYPVCVWINQDLSLSHWVVVYGYAGSGTNFKASDFNVIDPARCWNKVTRDRRLDEAYNYDGIYNTVVFK